VTRVPDAPTNMYAPAPDVTTTASPYREAPDALGPAAGGTLFPAGTAVAFLTFGFFITRVFVGLADQRARLGQAGTFATVAGVVLALVSIARFAWSASGARGAFASLALRAAAIAPVLALSLAAMFSTEVARPLQWASLGGLAALVVAVGGRAVALHLAGKRRVAAVTLALLVVGEGIELFGPAASLASRPGSALPRLADALGRVSEASTFVGVALAIVWAFRRAVEHLGVARAMAFLAMPAGFGAVLLTLPARLPRTTEMVARSAFGARFDLAGVGGAGHPTRLALTAYTLLFTGMVAAVSLSLATQSIDRGAGARRGLGWTCVLLAGFGAAGLAGPMDPLREVLVALGVLLLEQSAERE
jgi:hypothetical protein